ncbi:MAG: hypothetical protein H7841_05415 [Magnetospirillum sp. WYHS-4]
MNDSTPNAEAYRLLRHARQLMAGGQPALAIQILDRARGLAPDDIQILAVLATTLLLDRQKAKAAAVLRRLAEGGDPASLFGLCRPLMGADDPEGALALLRRAESAAAPSLFLALVRKSIADVTALGHRLTNARREDLALVAFRYAAHAMPEDFGVLEALLNHQLRLGDLEGALATVTGAPAFADPSQTQVFARYRHLCEWMRRVLAETPERAARLLATATGKPRMIHATVAWGADYVPLCARHLRCLAAPGNMPALARRFDLRIALVTTPPDYEALRATGALDLFHDICPVEPIFMPVEVVQRDEHLKPTLFMYYAFSMALHAGIDLARALDAAISPLAVDTVFADGAYGRLAELAEDGHEAICMTSMICRRETFVPELEARFAEPNGPIRIKAPDLMGMIAEHMHAITRCAFVSPANRDFSCPPGVLFWKRGRDVIAHGFCLDPVYISAGALARYRTYRFTSVDGHLAANIFPSPEDWKKVRVLADGADFAMLALSSVQQPAATIGGPFDLGQARLYKTVGNLISPFNEWTFRHPIVFRDVFPPGSPDEYDPAIVGAILEDDGIPLSSQPEAT